MTETNVVMVKLAAGPNKHIRERSRNQATIKPEQLQQLDAVVVVVEAA